jgi:fructose-1,6-bisphosphatase/inositol monophosphatase family enzyme
LAGVETDDVLALLRDVAERVIDPRFRSLDTEEISEKRPGDLVTAADHEAEELITEALLGAYPAAVVLGEEAYAQDPALLHRFATAEHAFTLDPVDGTKNFVHGSKDHAVMVAELRAGEVTRSWIWHPQHRTSYVAELGAGAFRTRDGEAPERLARPPAPQEPGDWRAVTARRSWVGRELTGLRPLELTWVCCGVDYARLVEGHADVVLYGHANAWDHAPGSLLLAEAGGRHGTLDGGPYRPHSTARPGLIAAADGATYDAMVPLAAELPRPKRRD